MPNAPNIQSPRLVTIAKILAVFTVLSSLIFSREILQSVEQEIAGGSSAISMTTESSVSSVNKKPGRYAIAMYVDCDDHMFGLYSILKQAQKTGMVADGIEVVVAISQHMMKAEEKHVREIERAKNLPPKPKTEAEKQEWIQSSLARMKDTRQRIADTQEQIATEREKSRTLTEPRAQEESKAKIQDLETEYAALLVSKTNEAEAFRELTKKKPKKMQEEGNIAVRKIIQWQNDGLIHHVYPFKRSYILDLVRGSGLWEGVFNKLFLFNLTQYDKLIRLDNDVLIRQHIGHWFDYETPTAIQAHDELEWNSGVMVISPNRTVFNDMIKKLPSVQRLNKEKSIELDAPDEWNSGVGEQGFLSSYFTTSKDPALRMKTMPTENAICISTLDLKHTQYFWYRRNHIIQTVHLTTEKPWYDGTSPNNPVQCDVLREWQASVVDIGRYNLTISNPYLQNCENASSVAPFKS